MVIKKLLYRYIYINLDACRVVSFRPKMGKMRVLYFFWRLTGLVLLFVFVCDMLYAEFSRIRECQRHDATRYRLVHFVLPNKTNIKQNAQKISLFCASSCLSVYLSQISSHIIILSIKIAYHG